MSEIKIRNRSEEMSFKQAGAIGFSLMEAAFGRVNKGEASDLISQLKSDDQESRENALEVIVEAILARKESE